MTMDEGDFDVIVLGTGITESIVTAALSKAGFKVAHLDPNPYYGSDNASLSLDELIEWADQHAHDAEPRFTSVSRSPTSLSQSRQYSISLSPSIIPSIGPFISALILSGVARYGGFRLVQKVSIHDSSGRVGNVPQSKEDVFKNKDITLVDKRRLMRFLMFASGDFEDKPELENRENMPFEEFLKSVFALNQEMCTVITFALAYCATVLDPTYPALCRIRRYLRSTGRYGPSSFLIGHYGGTGEIAQGFCRTAAVNGSVYILGRPIASATHSSVYRTTDAATSDSAPAYTLRLDDIPDALTCEVLISSEKHVPSELASLATYVPPTSSHDKRDGISVARCIAIVDQSISFVSPSSDLTTPSEAETTPEKEDKEEVDTAVLVFPPSTVPDGSAEAAVTTLIMGESSMSAPKGKWIIYLSMIVSRTMIRSESAERLLQPYLVRLLSLDTSRDAIQPLFTLFYFENPPAYPPSQPTSTAQLTTHRSDLLITPPLALHLSELCDSSASSAEAVFWEAVKVLKDSERVMAHRKRRLSEQNDNDGVDAKVDDIESFWPALERDPDDADEW